MDARTKESRGTEPADTAAHTTDSTTSSPSAPSGGPHLRGIHSDVDRAPGAAGRLAESGRLVDRSRRVWPVVVVAVDHVDDLHQACVRGGRAHSGYVRTQKRWIRPNAGGLEAQRWRTESGNGNAEETTLKRQQKRRKHRATRTVAGVVAADAGRVSRSRTVGIHNEDGALLVDAQVCATRSTSIRARQHSTQPGVGARTSARTLAHRHAAHRAGRTTHETAHAPKQLLTSCAHAYRFTGAALPITATASRNELEKCCETQQRKSLQQHKVSAERMA